MSDQVETAVEILLGLDTPDAIACLLRMLQVVPGRERIVLITALFCSIVCESQSDREVVHDIESRSDTLKGIHSCE